MIRSNFVLFREIADDSRLLLDYQAVESHNYRIIIPNIDII